MKHIATITKARPMIATDASMGMKKAKKKSARFGFLRAVAISIGIALPLALDDDDDAY